MQIRRYVLQQVFAVFTTVRYKKRRCRTLLRSPAPQYYGDSGIIPEACLPFRGKRRARGASRRE